jgi:SAM-dependent methyltransferase
MYVPPQRDLKVIADSISPRRGWDFSRMRAHRDPVPWEYDEVVRRYLMQSHRVLDIGTGGGERLLSFTDSFGYGVGIDANPDMIATARDNVPPKLRSKIDFAVMPAETLSVDDDSFDIVLNRHAPYSVAEIVRVLRPGGYFITQQVGRHNMDNIFDAFGWESSGNWWDSIRAKAGLQPLATERSHTAFEDAGYTIVGEAHYDVSYFVEDLASLIFWLQSVPLPEPFDIERHDSLLRKLVERHDTPRGFVPNEHRELLVVGAN